MPRWKQRKGRVFMRPFPLTLTLCGSFPSILSSPNLPQYTFRRLGRRRSRSLATPPSADERPQDAQVLPQHNGLPSPPARPPAPPPAPPSLARSSLFAQDKDRQSVSLKRSVIFLARQGSLRFLVRRVSVSFPPSFCGCRIDWLLFVAATSLPSSRAFMHLER